MPKTAYHITLKGYVGGSDFDRTTVDRVLSANEGKHVDVLIDSLGGSVATALSIASAFRRHGDVAVHFVGLNASAATIASLGAKSITIDTGAMYLVHKCSMDFCEWGQLNADQFAQLIAECEKVKEDLDKLDANIAALYARRCKKEPKDLLALMARGGWLTSQEAKDWGFIDEVTDLADEPAPRLTDSVAADLAACGIPVPNLPLADREGLFGRFLAALTAFFTRNHQPANDMTPEPAPTTPQADEPQAPDLQAQLDAANARVKDLEAQLAAKPAADTQQVVENDKPADPAPSPLDDYSRVVAEAKKMFNSIP